MSSQSRLLKEKKMTRPRFCCTRRTISAKIINEDVQETVRGLSSHGLWSAIPNLRLPLLMRTIFQAVFGPHFVVLYEKSNQRKRAGSRAVFEFSWFEMSEANFAITARNAHCWSISLQLLTFSTRWTIFAKIISEKEQGAVPEISSLGWERLGINLCFQFVMLTITEHHWRLTDGIGS